MKIKFPSRRADGRPKVSIRVVVGAGLVVAGVATAAWGYWGTTAQDNILAGEQQQTAQTYVQPSATAKAEQKFVDPDDANTLADIFGRIYIPRIDEKYVRLVAEGTRWHPVLNEIGIGHYTKTQMPGEVGNFAVAAHRGGFGGAFRDIHRIKPGDHVYVETSEAWYDYEYRQSVIVKPEQIDVINKVPVGMDGAHEGGKYMTLTSCEPIYVNTERIIVWLELVDTRSKNEGPFKEISWAK
jgi:sortase A